MSKKKTAKKVAKALTSLGLKEKLKASKLRLPHGYKLVKRKKTKTKTKTKKK